MYNGDRLAINLTRTLTGSSGLFEIVELNATGSVIRTEISVQILPNQTSVHGTYNVTRQGIFSVRLTNNSTATNTTFSGRKTYTKNAQTPSFQIHSVHELDANAPVDVKTRWLPREILNHGGGFTCIINTTMYHSAATIPGVQTATNAAANTWAREGGGRVAINNNPARTNTDIHGRANPPSHFNDPEMIAYVSLWNNRNLWVTHVDQPSDFSGARSGRHYIVYSEIHVFSNNFTTYNADMQRRIMVHEFGHVVGLGHPRTSLASIMHGTPTTMANNPTDFDRTGIRLFYSN
jgi:hypothetical protein